MIYFLLFLTIGFIVFLLLSNHNLKKSLLNNDILFEEMKNEYFRKEQEKTEEKILKDEFEFFLCDLFHSEKNINKFTTEEIFQIFSDARMFTVYRGKFVDIKKLKEFNKYLKNDIWTKVYGKPYDSFK